MKKLIFIILIALFFSCTEENIVPSTIGRGVVISIEESKLDSKCIYNLDLVIPYQGPSQMSFKDTCNKYHVGDIVMI